MIYFDELLGMEFEVPDDYFDRKEWVVVDKIDTHLAYSIHATKAQAMRRQLESGMRATTIVEEF